MKRIFLFFGLLNLLVLSNYHITSAQDVQMICPPRGRTANIRNLPTTVGDETRIVSSFRDSRQVMGIVQSDDPKYPTWYQVQLSDGSAGFVAYSVVRDCTPHSAPQPEAVSSMGAFSLPSSDTICLDDLSISPSQIPYGGCYWHMTRGEVPQDSPYANAATIPVSEGGWVLCHTDSPCGQELLNLRVGDTWQANGRVVRSILYLPLNLSVKYRGEDPLVLLTRHGASFYPVAQVCTSESMRKIIIFE